MNLEKNIIMDTDEPQEDALAITWAPRPLDLDPIGQLQHYTENLRQLLNLCCSCQISPELFVNGSLHFHITARLIKKSYRIAFYKHVLPAMRRQGFVKIKKIDDLVQWVKYCSKDDEIMKEILNMDLPLTRDSKIFKRERHKKCRSRIPEHKEVKFEGNIIKQCDDLASSQTSSDESGA